MDALITLIDAHGPDHGLRVVVNLRDRYDGRSESTVEIAQWAELSEPDDSGSYRPHIQRGEVSLQELLTGEHMKHAGPARGGVHGLILNAATAWLAYWGGDEDYVDDTDRPCDHFGCYWGRHQARHRLGCDACGEYAGGPCACHA